ncbi:MAG TPA: phosphopantetheine adenylyltransferase [Candidatus Bathyarchaeia archaeon]|nr:phosphopantetheine adenylyltransferase [Candidatus Bathyarchaeia archaeon]
MKKFRKVAVGGTFDELHKGHKVLLMKAFEIGERVVVGLCTDEFAEKLGKPHITAPYEERLKELKAFLNNLGLLGRAEIIPLNDPFGPTLAESCIEALVVSEETRPTAFKINEKRLKAGLPPLKIITINMVPAENCTPISTTRIRKGEIDHEGRLLKRSRNF